MSRLHNATPARTWNNLYCFIVCLTLIFPKAEGTVQTNEGRLHDVLLRGYNKYTHPSTNVTEPVRVVFDFQLIRIVGVSAKDQYIKTYAWVNQYWNNSQLVWDPDDYGGIKEIHLRPQDVWVPDILLYNNVDEEDRFGGGLFTYKTNVALRYDGYNKWLNPAIFKSICSVDVTYFPFDDQTCEMKFGSWSFDISKINLFARRVKKNFNYVKNGEFKLLDLDVKRNVVKYQCCAHAFVDVTVVINIRRESLDYILKLIIPCSLISSMIFLGFILPPESGERIGLSITVMLAMTVFQQLSSELMPSYGFPLLGQYYFATIIEIGSSLFVTTLILNFYHRNSRRMPRTLRKFIIRWLARIVFPFQKPKDWNPSVGGCSLRRHHNNGQDDDSIEEESQMCDEFEPSNAENDPWVPFPLKRNEPMDTHVTPNGVSISKPARNDGSYQLTDLGYDTGHARPRDRCGMMSVNGARCSRKGSARNGKSGKAYRRNKENFRRARTHKTSASNSSHLMPFFQGNSASIEMSEEKLKNQKEWIKAARVLDRLFLIVSVTIGVLTLLGIFLKAPRFRLT